MAKGKISCLTRAWLLFLSDLHIAEFSIKESIRVIAVNSAPVNCFAERRNGDVEAREIGVRLGGASAGEGRPGRQRILALGLGRFGHLAGTLFRAVSGHHRHQLQSSHFSS